LVRPLKKRKRRKVNRIEKGRNQKGGGEVPTRKGTREDIDQEEKNIQEGKEQGGKA